MRGRERNINRLWTTAHQTLWRLEPCPHCGSTRRAPTVTREVAYLLCLDCWRDHHDVEWPPDPYVHVIDQPERWRAAGIVLPSGVPNPFTVDRT